MNFCCPSKEERGDAYKVPDAVGGAVAAAANAAGNENQTRAGPPDTANSMAGVMGMAAGFMGGAGAGGGAGGAGGAGGGMGMLGSLLPLLSGG